MRIPCNVRFLLVCLQLIIISLMSLRVEGREGGNRPSVDRLLDSEIPPGPSMARACRLFSRGAQRNVLIQGKVTASANSTDTKGQIQLQTVLAMAGRVKTRIYGLDAGRYICFNHKGRLVTKPKNKARGAKCEFIEEVDSVGWSQFRSAKNKDWFIGFNHKGRPLLATAYLLQTAAGRNKNNFDFLKMPSYPPSYFNHHHHHRHGRLSSSLSNQGKHFNFDPEVKPSGRRRGAIYTTYSNN